MTHILDRVVWNALSSLQAAHSEGGPLARRYRPDILPFAAAADQGDQSLAALSRLPRHQEMIVQLEADPILPRGCRSVRTGTVIQMAHDGAAPWPSEPRGEELHADDAEEMLELAQLTQPGPFTLRAQALGTFRGIRVDGKLVAMAGERMRVDGFSEVSGVCTHPEHRGQGYARALSIATLRRILARGETPFLHAWETNGAAIALYESIGFSVRGTFKLLGAVIAD